MKNCIILQNTKNVSSKSTSTSILSPTSWIFCSRRLVSISENYLV